MDYTEKRKQYGRFGVGEYSRFRPSGAKYHDAAPMGDCPVDSKYVPIAIETLVKNVFGEYRKMFWAVLMLRGRNAENLRPSNLELSLHA